MYHPLSIVAALTGAALLTLVFRGPLARWYRKVRRRRGGVYLWRVDHHRNRARRVNGYVGETVSFYFRSRQHMGISHFSDTGKGRLTTAVKVPSQPWSDLNPVMHKVIPLPWWLCWKWVLRPLETLVILCTWPVYNDAKNHWNPRRITKSLARVHRSQRDNMGVLAGIWRPWTAHLLRRLLVGLVLLVICLAAYAWEIYR
jgi:hypothetical protein